MMTYDFENVAASETQTSGNNNFEKAVSFLNISVQGKRIGSIPLRKSKSAEWALHQYLSANPDADIASVMSVQFNGAEQKEVVFDF
ncbi:MAG TPA: hypothetical protein VFC79_08325 [Tissierellaceae bacterium]|nr:hypothetical protein [Tissierellaceae bacterium]